MQAQSQFGTDGTALEESETSSAPAVTTAVTTQQLNLSQPQETIAQQPLQTQTLQQPQVQQQRSATSIVSTSVPQTLQHQPPVLVAKPSIPTSTPSQPAQPAIEEATSAASITVGPDQQQVFYSGK